MRITKALNGNRVSFASTALALLFLAINSAPTVLAASFAQGYHSSQQISTGAVVSLTKSGSSEVKTTDLTTEELILGITVDSDNAIVDLQPTGSDIRVAISGETPVLVSDVGGAIKAGDALIISQINGVAMKDTDSSDAKRYIGIASEDFKTNSSSTKEVTIKDGESDKKVHVGLIKAKILLTNRKAKANPNPIYSFIQKVVGKPVGTAQVVGALAVFLTTFVFTALVLNGSIKGSFVSIGRNPLSKHTIIGNMIRVSVICLIILVAGVSMSYVILLI